MEIASVRVGDPQAVPAWRALLRLQRPHWTYRVCALAQDEGREELLVARRRYSDFAALHAALHRGRAGTWHVPPGLPTRTLWPLGQVPLRGRSPLPLSDAGSMTTVSLVEGRPCATDFFHKRAAALERYLARVVRHPALRTHPALRLFLEAPTGGFVQALRDASLGGGSDLLPESAPSQWPRRGDAVDDAFERLDTMLASHIGRRDRLHALRERTAELQSRVEEGADALSAVLDERRIPSSPPSVLAPLEEVHGRAVQLHECLEALSDILDDAAMQRAELHAAMARRAALVALYDGVRAKHSALRAELAELAQRMASGRSPRDADRARELDTHIASCARTESTMRLALDARCTDLVVEMGSLHALWGAELQSAVDAVDAILDT